MTQHPSQQPGRMVVVGMPAATTSWAICATDRTHTALQVENLRHTLRVKNALAFATSRGVHFSISRVVGLAVSLLQYLTISCVVFTRQSAQMLGPVTPLSTSTLTRLSAMQNSVFTLVTHLCCPSVYASATSRIAVLASQFFRCWRTRMLSTFSRGLS